MDWLPLPLLLLAAGAVCLSAAVAFASARTAIIGVLLLALACVSEFATGSLKSGSRSHTTQAVAGQFGRNTVTAECGAVIGESGVPAPCRIERPALLRGDDVRNVKRFATLHGNRFLEVSECLTRTPDAESLLCEETHNEFFSLATDRRGLDIDLNHIIEVTFISPSGGAETVRVKQQE